MSVITDIETSTVRNPRVIIVGIGHNGFSHIAQRLAQRLNELSEGELQVVINESSEFAIYNSIYEYALDSLDDVLCKISLKTREIFYEALHIGSDLQSCFANISKSYLRTANLIRDGPRQCN